MSEEWGKLWQIQHQISKVQMPFLYKRLKWPSAEHIHSVDGKGELSWRGWNGDCSSFIPRSPPKLSNWERSLFPSFSYFFITFIDCPPYGRHWARSWGPAHKIKVLRGRQTLIKDSHKYRHNGVKGVQCRETVTGVGGGQRSLRLVTWAKGAEKEAPGKSPEEWESGLVAGRVDCHTKPCQAPESLFPAGQMVQIPSTPDCFFPNKIGTSTSGWHSPCVLHKYLLK